MTKFDKLRAVIAWDCVGVAMLKEDEVARKLAMSAPWPVMNLAHDCEIMEHVFGLTPYEAYDVIRAEADRMGVDISEFFNK